MNASRLWVLASITVIIALVVGTWFVGVSPRLAEASAANVERASVELLNQKHAATVAALEKQSLSKLTADLEAVRIGVPATDDSAALYRQLHSLASNSGVTIAELTLGAPERFAPPVEASADTELAAALGSVGPENFLVIPVEQTIDGPYSAVMTFIAALQTGDRTFLVHDLSFNTGIPAGDSTVSVTFSGQVFVLLDGVAPSAAPEGAVAPAAEAEAPQ